MVIVRIATEMPSRDHGMAMVPVQKCPSEITGQTAFHRWMPSDPTVNNPVTICKPWRYHINALDLVAVSLLNNNALYSIDSVVYSMCRLIPW